MHVRKTARDALFPSKEDDAFFAPRRGDIVFRDNAAVRAFADRVNRGELRSGEAMLRPAELAAMALVHEVLHAVVGKYRERHPDSFHRFSAMLHTSLGDEARKVVVDFLTKFPPPVVYRTLRGEGNETPERYLERTKASAPRVPIEIELDEELILLWVTNQNPAYDPVRTLVADHELGPAYRVFVAESRRFFESEPPFGPKGETLVELLLAPGRAHPTSIFAQLEYMERSWGRALGLDELALWRRFAALRDLRTEEGKWFFRGGPGPGEPLLEAMRFGRKEDEEPARFSPDLNWMPNVVLIAKSVYVWLDQLGKKYGRWIHTLDQVPDEELDLLASRHITGLWLIGLFERSRASRKIKQMRGDHDALASAYSLKAYEIADELGGVPAYENLKGRAWARGIRLAADMVPNHVGIDGDWVMKHPDWFLQTRTPPFPAYRFGGPDLSEDERVGVFLEEGYWSKTDAAVVFRRHDRWTGEDRFIYHGNDGTSMPWNDTAQLDYLNPELRHAIIETILHVARMFPIIRFDAAMTLAKRHIQRLWYPLPGQGGAIPSRSDYAMTQEEFDRAIPVEFWREVVDAVAARAPDTLLLAEAFWMMEGYFVRTLGMHRVYNSAFMNMLKREENDKYRATIKNVLDFDPEILKRFVNFMNNPDEETAIAQFGDDDKYFGVCTLMCTMPGLPMFGHGQIEGLHEKYGMEYRRARWDEHPNEHLIRRHEREIFPVLEKRYLFSGVEHFALYDFVTEGGWVDEDVFAYSNGAGDQRALVLYNNKFKTTRGRIQASTHRGSLGRELALDEDRGAWLVIRDVPNGLEYLRTTKDIIDGGMTWELQAFKYHVLTGFRPVNATLERPYHRLAAELAGRGAPDIERAVRELYLRPVHAPLREACSKGHLAYLASQLDAEDDVAARTALEERLGHVADGLEWMLTERAQREVTIDRAPALESAVERFIALHSFVRADAKASSEAPLVAPRTSTTTEREPSPAPLDKSQEAPARVGEARAESNGNTTEPSQTGTAAVVTASVLHVDLLLAWIQVEAVMDLIAAGDAALEEARSRPPAYLSTLKGTSPADAPASAATVETIAEPAAAAPLTSKDATTDTAKATVASPAPAAEAHGAVEATWATREALLAQWELATPLVEGFATTVADDEAKRRAALVILAATLPSGPLAPALRLALGSPRGQAYMNVHEADGVIWLVKERFEELARFLAEREIASGRVAPAVAKADAEAFAKLAEREGYRAERIAAKLGPAPRTDAPIRRIDESRPSTAG